MNKYYTNNFELKTDILEKEIIEEYNKNAELSLYNKDKDSVLSEKIGLDCFYNEIYLNEEKLFSKRNILLSFKFHNSSIQLQNNLIGASNETINYLLKELKGEFRKIIKYKNGNYFFYCLIKKCNKEQRLLIINELYNTVSDDCLDEFANHSLQALIEIASSEEEFKLLLSSFNDCNKIAMETMLYAN